MNLWTCTIVAAVNACPSLIRGSEQNFVYASTSTNSGIMSAINIEGLASGRSNALWIESQMKMGIMSSSRPPFSNLGVLEHTKVSFAASGSQSLAYIYKHGLNIGHFKIEQRGAITVRVIFFAHG